MGMAGQHRDHGGNLDAAIAEFGGARDEWIDLSTGINPCAYPIAPISPDAWSALPRRSDMLRLRQAAQRVFGCKSLPVPFAGAQGVIQMVPFLAPDRQLSQGQARILGPTYNEHAAALRMGGWTVGEVNELPLLRGADIAVVVNPNNPDGRFTSREALLALAKDVGLLIVDESFIDPTEHLSIASHLHEDHQNIVVLRSFGKFYGLAGLRLGFAIASAQLSAHLEQLSGPWPICGPAIDIACSAYGDAAWRSHTCARLEDDTNWLDARARALGWQLVGGTTLFRTYAVEDAKKAQVDLARAHIWSRIFPYSKHWIRLGVPGIEQRPRVQAGLKNCSK